MELIVGPMYSGKSAELVRRVHLAELAQLEVRVFRPSTDTRTPHASVASRNGMRAAAREVACPADILAHTPSATDVVAVDEAQFFDASLEELVRSLLRAGKRVIVAGLDLDFASQPFGPMPRLLALADAVDKLAAVCMVCHSFSATRTQRLVNGSPASAGSPQIVVDHSALAVTYEARCATCYMAPLDSLTNGSRLATSAAPLHG